MALKSVSNCAFVKFRGREACIYRTPNIPDTNSNNFDIKRPNSEGNGAVGYNKSPQWYSYSLAVRLAHIWNSQTKFRIERIRHIIVLRTHLFVAQFDFNVGVSLK